MIATTQAPPNTRHFLRHNKAFNLGLLLTKRAHYLDALDRFKSLLHSNSKLLPDILIPLYKQLMMRHDDLHLRILIGELYMTCGREDEALVELEDCLDIDPHFPNTYLILSKLYRNQAYKAKVTALFERAFENGIVETAVTDHLAHVYLETAQHEKAITLFEYLTQIYPENVYHKKTLAELYNQTHAFLKAARQYEALSQLAPEHTAEVAERCEHLTTFDPDNVDIRRILIQLYFKCCHPEKCIEHSHMLIHLDPSTKPGMIAMLQELLDVSPHNPDVMITASQLLIEEGRMVDGIVLLRELTELNATYHDDALRQLQLVLTQQPKQYMALELVADILLAQDKMAQVLPLLEQMLSAAPEDVSGIEDRLSTIMNSGSPYYLDAVCLLGKVYLQSGQYDRCIAQVAMCMGTDRERDASLTQAKAEIARHQPEQAKKVLLDTLKHHPYDSEVHDLLMSAYTDILQQELDEHRQEQPKKQQNQHWFKLGLLHLRHYDLLLALENFQKIHNSPVLQQKAHMLMGRCFLEMGRFDLSTKQFGDLLHANVDDPALYNQLRFAQAINFIHSGQTQKSVDLLEQILASDVHFPYLNTLLNQYRNQGSIDVRGRALSACYTHNTLYILSTPNMEGRITVGGQRPHRASFGMQHNDQAVDYTLRQHYKAAEEELDLAEQIESDLTVVYCNRAILYLMNGETKRAIEKLHIALSLNANLDIPYINLGLVAMKEKDWESAEWHFQKALNINPNSAIANLNLGDVFAHKKDMEQALRYWHRANAQGTLFYLTHRRVHYLQQQRFSFKHWMSDFSHPLTPMMPDDVEAPPLVDLVETGDPSPSIDRPLPLFT